MTDKIYVTRRVAKHQQLPRVSGMSPLKLLVRIEALIIFNLFCDNQTGELMGLTTAPKFLFYVFLIS